MMINALNSKADCYMSDLEDSMSPSWENVVKAHDNLYKLSRDNLFYTIYNKYNSIEKNYKVDKNPSTLHLRVRGLHLQEKHVYDQNNNFIPAMIFDIGMHMINNASLLHNKNLGPYFYIPKIETYEEAQHVNNILVDAQKMLNLPIGSVKTTLLIETLPAIFQTEEIMYALKDHIVGLNCGRWDYIFSYIKTFQHNENLVLPHKDFITMDQPFLNSYVQQIVNTCHKRNILAMGGMSAFIPTNNSFDNKTIFKNILIDKELEIKNGCDGAWVAHPGLVQPVKQLFQDHFYNNQIHKYTNNNINSDDLINPTINTNDSDLLFTENGIRKNINVSLQYLAAWLFGNGAVAINNLMEDMATSEISCFQLKQWINNNTLITDDNNNTYHFNIDKFNLLLDEETNKLLIDYKHDVRYANDFLYSAKNLIQKYVSSTDELFLSSISYDELDTRNKFKSIEFSENELKNVNECKNLQGIELTKHRGIYINFYNMMQMIKIKFHHIINF